MKSEWLGHALLVVICQSTEAVSRRCSVKKVLLDISQNSQESTCARVSFLIKLQQLSSGAIVLESKQTSLHGGKEEKIAIITTFIEWEEAIPNMYFIHFIKIAVSLILKPEIKWKLQLIIQIGSISVKVRNCLTWIDKTNCGFLKFNLIYLNNFNCKMTQQPKQE